MIKVLIGDMRKLNPAFVKAASNQFYWNTYDDYWVDDIPEYLALFGDRKSRVVRRTRSWIK